MNLLPCFIFPCGCNMNSEGSSWPSFAITLSEYKKGLLLTKASLLIPLGVFSAQGIIFSPPFPLELI